MPRRSVAGTMRATRGRIGRTAALLLAGLLGTVAVAFVLLPVTGAVQLPVYGAVYAALGPTDATVAATLAHVVLVGVVAVATPVAIAHHLAGGTADARQVAAGVGVVLLLFAAVVALAFVGPVPFGAAVVLLVVAFAGVPAVLRYRFGVRSGGLTALAGALPAVLLLLFLAGFGLGWGWGYVVHAEAVPGGTTDGAATADFDEVPTVRDDLFGPDACEGDADSRACILQLRGYEHERTAARFLDRHGVRCPLATVGGGDSGTVLAGHDGTTYRVACSPHGD